MDEQQLEGYGYPLRENEILLEHIKKHIDSSQRRPKTSVSRLMVSNGYQSSLLDLSSILQFEEFIVSDSRVTESLRTISESFVHLDNLEGKPKTELERFRPEFDRAVVELRRLAAPHVERSLFELVKVFGSLKQNMSSVAELIPNLPLMEQDRNRRFQLIEKAYEERTAEFRGLDSVEVVLAYDNYLDDIEKKHIEGQEFALKVVFGSIAIYCFLLVLSIWFPILPKYDPAKISTGVVLDLLYVLKQLSPIIVTISAVLVGLRFYSLERHSLLMTRQKRSSVRLAISALTNLDLDAGLRSQLLTAMTSALSRLHGTGYVKKGLDPFVSESVASLKKDGG